MSPGEFVIGALFMGVVFAIAMVIILALAPGMLVNLMLDRFADAPDGFIMASMSDKPTWYVSIFFWTCVYVWGRERIQRWRAHQQQPQQNQ